MTHIKKGRNIQLIRSRIPLAVATVCVCGCVFACLCNVFMQSYFMLCSKRYAFLFLIVPFLYSFFAICCCCLLFHWANFALFIHFASRIDLH